MTAQTDALATFSELVQSATHIVVFSGAGLSTESGIPDFRSPGTGLWTKMKPIQFQDFVASEEIRTESWRRRFDGDRTLAQAEPNRGHRAVARLNETGQLQAVITQNVDNLHQASGLPDERIIELHGNTTYASCLDCGLRREMAEVEAEFHEHDRVKPCASCGGIIKSATISFGQAMPEHEMARAQQATETADLFIVVGSSLSVQPAAGFPAYAHQLGCPLVIVNREPTPLDSMADIVLHTELGDTLSFALGLNE